jgi:hypothetical protein
MSSTPGRARAILPLVFAILGCASVTRAQAPASVGIPGNYQSEAGCSCDWDPA